MEEGNRPGCSQANAPFPCGEELNGNDSQYPENVSERQQEHQMIEQQPQNPLTYQHPRSAFGSFLASPPNSQIMQNTITKLNTELAEQSVQLSVQNQRLISFDNDLKKFQGQMTEYYREKLEAEQKCTILSNRMQMELEKNQQMEENLGVLKKKLNNIETEKEEVELKNKEAQETITDLKKSSAEKNELIKELEEANKRLQVKIEAKEIELKKTQTSYEHMKYACGTETDRCNGIKKELELSQTREKDLEDKLAKEEETKRDLVEDMILVKMNLTNQVSTSFNRFIEKCGGMANVVVQDGGNDAKVSEEEEEEVKEEMAIEDEKQEEEVLGRSTRFSSSFSTSKSALGKQEDSPQKEVRRCGRTSSGKRKRPFTCSDPNCNKTFSIAHTLEIHEKREHNIWPMKKRSKSTPVSIAPGKVKDSAGNGVTYAEICNTVATQCARIKTNNVVDIGVDKPPVCSTDL